MNCRERFHETMNFNTNARSIKWEMGYWGETIEKWYKSGLPQKKYPVLDKTISTPTSSLYSTAWTRNGVNKVPNGICVLGGGLYWPTQGFPLDNDVREHFKMDFTQQVVDVNLHFSPMFDIKILAEDDERLEYIDIDGIRRIFLKHEATIPTAVEWPITDRKSWEKLKEERLNLKDIKSRFPKYWDELLKGYKNRDYPLALGGYPQGFFGTPAHLIGYENLFMLYCSDPDMVHDIMNTFTNLWLAVFEEVLSQVEIDHWQIFEDISFGRGSMISVDMVREFMNPYIKKIADFLKTKGVNIVLLDTDGDCNELIPVFMEAGVTGMYPFETKCGMDIVKVRKQYPKLQMLGGIPKSEIAKGKAAIDKILEPVDDVLKTGGYIPFGDHSIPPDVDFENFSYYRNKLNSIIDKNGKY